MSPPRHSRSACRHRHHDGSLLHHRAGQSRRPSPSLAPRSPRHLRRSGRHQPIQSQEDRRRLAARTRRAESRFGFPTSSTRSRAAFAAFEPKPARPGATASGPPACSNFAPKSASSTGVRYRQADRRPATSDSPRWPAAAPANETELTQLEAEGQKLERDSEAATRASTRVRNPDLDDARTNRRPRGRDR